MPMVVSLKQRIHYKIEGEHGPYMVFAAPLPDSLEVWYRAGYVEGLAANNRLVLVDPLGQGRSDAPTDPEAYAPEARAQHIIDLLEELGVDRFHFIGAGLGGVVGYQLAASHPNRVRSLTISAAHPFPVARDAVGYKDLIPALRERGLEALEAHVARESGPVGEARRAEWAPLAPEALALALEAHAAWEGVSVERLSKLRVPAMLLTSTQEERFLSLREAGRTMPLARYNILPKLEFADGLLKAETILPHHADFLRRQRT